jgi:hypothetical protein
MRSPCPAPRCASLWRLRNSAARSRCAKRNSPAPTRTCQSVPVSGGIGRTIHARLYRPQHELWILRADWCEAATKAARRRSEPGRSQGCGGRHRMRLHSATPSSRWAPMGCLCLPLASKATQSSQGRKHASMTYGHRHLLTAVVMPVVTLVLPGCAFNLDPLSSESPPPLGPVYIHFVQRTAATRLMMAAKHLSVFS